MAQVLVLIILLFSPTISGQKPVHECNLLKLCSSMLVSNQLEYIWPCPSTATCHWQGSLIYPWHDFVVQDRGVYVSILFFWGSNNWINCPVWCVLICSDYCIPTHQQTVNILITTSWCAITKYLLGGVCLKQINSKNIVSIVTYYLQFMLVHCNFLQAAVHVEVNGGKINDYHQRCIIHSCSHVVF